MVYANHDLNPDLNRLMGKRFLMLILIEFIDRLGGSAIDEFGKSGC
jgi:hypothetical protein